MSKAFTRGATPVYVDPTTKEAVMNVAGSMTATVTGGLDIPSWDYCKVTYPDGTTEVYTFKTGGSGGTTVLVLTVVYTTSTKDILDTITRS